MDREEESRLDRELAFHLERQIEANMAAGMTAQEARRRAVLAFGGREQIKEEVRDVHRFAWLDNFRRDVNYAFRSLRKNPGATLIAILILALGIGANTAIFSVVNSILLRPLPFPDSGRLMLVTGFAVRQQASLETLRDHGRAADYAGYDSGNQVNLTGMGEPLRVSASNTSAEFFSVLGVKPLRGRTFVSGENQPGKDQVMLIGESLWQSRFSRDPEIIGRVVTVDDVARKIVGVLPTRFRWPIAETEVWIPLHIDPVRNDGAYWWNNSINIVGRLHPGVSQAQALAEIRTFIPQIRDRFPWKMWPDWGANTGLIPLQDSLVQDVRTRLLILLGAVGLVLLISCANFANLQLLKAAVKQREISVRAALGASRGQIISQLLTESMILAGVGSLVGLGIAAITTELFRSYLPVSTPRVTEIAIDTNVLLFALGIALVTGLGFGLLPALRSSRPDLQNALRASDRTALGSWKRSWLLGSLVIAEIAMAVIVVIGSGLLIKSVARLSSVRPGFDASHVLSARVSPNQSLCKQPARCYAFYDELLSRVRTLPGVESASAVNVLPLSGDSSGLAVELTDHLVPPGSPADALWFSSVDPEYLRTMRIPVLAGRGFTDADREGARGVALISELTARHYWPSENAIGKQVKAIYLKDWRTIVGIVRDVKVGDLVAESEWQKGAMYLPYRQPLQWPESARSLVVRTAGDPLALAPALRKLVQELNHDAPVTQVRTMEEVVSSSIATPRSTMWLFTAFAGLALVLGAIGIYGVISYSVTQRVREIGLRMALGANRSDIRNLILRQVLMLGALGLLIGIPAAVAFTRTLQKLLYQVGTTDPATYLCVSLVVVAVTLAAGYVPTRRAMRLDPAITLREE